MCVSVCMCVCVHVCVCVQERQREADGEIVNEVDLPGSHPWYKITVQTHTTSDLVNTLHSILSYHLHSTGTGRETERNRGRGRSVFYNAWVDLFHCLSDGRVNMFVCTYTHTQT